MLAGVIGSYGQGQSFEDHYSTRQFTIYRQSDGEKVPAYVNRGVPFTGVDVVRYNFQIGNHSERNSKPVQLRPTSPKQHLAKPHQQ